MKQYVLAAAMVFVFLVILMAIGPSTRGRMVRQDKGHPKNKEVVDTIHHWDEEEPGAPASNYPATDSTYYHG